MTTLTDRYVWAVVRTAPEKQRPELEAEVRALVADATDARLDAGSSTAERDALVELGDPQALAAQYADRPLTLIGPQYYLLWLRLLKLMLATVVPVGALGIGIGQFVSGAALGDIIGAMVSGAIGIVVHLCFWLTAVFAMLDRNMGGKPLMEWAPEQLPEVPTSTKRSALGELIASVVWLVIFAIVIVAQQFYSVFPDDDGNPIPFFDPALWSFWLPWFIGLALLEIGFAFAVYFRGWSYPLAAVNVLLNIAFAVPAIWLLTLDKLINPVFADAVALRTDDGFDQAMGITMLITVVAIAVFAGWDIVEGFLKARRARHPRFAPAAASAPTH